MARGSKGKNFFMGAVVGGVLGSVTALLFAPKSGDKVRKDIARKYNDFSDKTQKMVCDMSEQALEIVEKAKDLALDAKDSAQCLFKELGKRK